MLPLSATLTPLVKLTHKVIQHLMRFMTKAPFSPQGDANVVLTLLPLPGRIQSFSSTISQLHPSLHCNGVILLLTHSRETAPLDDLVTILCSHAIIWHAHTVMSVQLVLLKVCYKHCCAEECRAGRKHFISPQLMCIFRIYDQIFMGIFVFALPLTSVTLVNTGFTALMFS